MELEGVSDGLVLAVVEAVPVRLRDAVAVQVPDGLALRRPVGVAVGVGVGLGDADSVGVPDAVPEACGTECGLADRQPMAERCGDPRDPEGTVVCRDGGNRRRLGGVTDGDWGVTDGGWGVTDGGWGITDGGWGG